MAVRLCLLGLCLGVLSACGGSNGTGSLRFVQASPNVPLVNLLVDGNTVASSLGYGNATGYITLGGGSRHVQVVPSNGGSPIFDTSVSVVSSGDETLIMTGPVSGPNSLLLTDSSTTSTVGDGSVRVVDAASAITAADVYIVSAGTSIAGISATFDNLTFNTNTGYQLVPTGAYEVLLTAPGTKNAFMDTGTLNMTSSENQTVIVLNGAVSGFTFTVLTDQ